MYVSEEEKALLTICSNAYVYVYCCLDIIICMYQQLETGPVMANPMEQYAWRMEALIWKEEWSYAWMECGELRE